MSPIRRSAIRFRHVVYKQALGPFSRARFGTMKSGASERTILHDRVCDGLKAARLKRTLSTSVSVAR